MAKKNNKRPEKSYPEEKMTVNNIKLQRSLYLELWQRRVLILMILLSFITLVYVAKELFQTHQILRDNLNLNEYIRLKQNKLFENKLMNPEILIDAKEVGALSGNNDEGYYEEISTEMLGKIKNRLRKLIYLKPRYDEEGEESVDMESQAQEEDEEDDEECDEKIPEYIDDDEYPRYTLKTTVVNGIEFTITTIS